MLRISTDPTDLDISRVHQFLAQHSNWARDIPRSVLERAIAHSLCFGGYIGTDQVAFARVISDYATFANLVDVFVVPEYRGLGYSKQLMGTSRNRRERVESKAPRAQEPECTNGYMRIPSTEQRSYRVA